MSELGSFWEERRPPNFIKTSRVVSVGPTQRALSIICAVQTQTLKSASLSQVFLFTQVLGFFLNFEFTFHPPTEAGLRGLGGLLKFGRFGVKINPTDL